MRILGVTETCDLSALYLRLLEEGHEVKVAISEPLARGTLAGLVEQVPDWRSALDWVGPGGRGGIILFESVSEGFGALQDELRRDGYRVIGGSAYGDRLENDRAYAQRVLAGLGFPAGHVWEFPDAHAASDFVRGRPARYVLKLSGADHEAADTYVGELPDGRDIVAMLKGRFAPGTRSDARFILMEHIEGVEMGVGAYFDGAHFLLPACLDWEHKRFFAGDLGELTGEMGTVATLDRTGRFFERTLLPLEPLLREHGHVGYVNLNTIVNEGGIWPLEFTCRFGYPGFAILSPLQETPWGELLGMIAERAGGRFLARNGFSVGVVLTTPPFPYSRKQVAEPVGLPVLFEGPLDAEDRRNIHYGELGLVGGELATSGLYGWSMVVTGVAPTIVEARAAAYRRVGRITIPNVRYRLDIGARLLDGDYERIEALGLLDPVRTIRTPSRGDGYCRRSPGNPT